jgi:hypothetical protein
MEAVMQFTRISFAVLLFFIASLAVAQEKAPAKMAAKKTGGSDAHYTAQALASAPTAVSKQASVVRFDKDGKMETLREGTNGFTCFVMMGDAMCADANSMAFFGAMMKKETPPDKTGVTYMLHGDNGASNTDPTAEKKTADNHWVVTGPHIMVVGAAAKSMGLPDSDDADPSKPYLMWAKTPYAHAMVPVGGAAHTSAATAKPASEMKDMK